MGTFRRDLRFKNLKAHHARLHTKIAKAVPPGPPIRELSLAVPRERLISDLIHRDSDRCYLCRTTLAQKPDYHVEHIVARHNGGTDDPSNLALACRPCNYRKGTYYVSLTISDHTPVLSL